MGLLVGCGFDLHRSEESIRIERERIEFGISKAIDILLDLGIEEETIRHAIIKHFDLRYSEATTAIWRLKNTLAACKGATGAAASSSIG